MRQADSPARAACTDARARDLTYRRMIQLTAPTLGLSLALSLVTTYLPLALQRYTSSATLIGFAIGGEGIFALAIPLAVGAFSDRIWTRWGRRQPFMILAAPPMAAALVLAPFQRGYLPIALSVFVFFAAYHVYTAPYQALIPDFTPVTQHGRVQGFQTLMRGSGMFLGMVVAGMLLSLWEPLPYLAAGLFVIVVTYYVVANIHETRPTGRNSSGTAARISPRGMWGGLKDVWRTTRGEGRIQRLLVANYLWESTIQGLRPFIMLYFLYTFGVGTKSGALLLGLVGVTYVVAGLVSGFLADRVGRRRVMWVGLAIYFVGCAIGFFVRDIWTGAILLPLFGLGGSIVLTMPYAIMMGMMPPARVGQFTGLFSLSRGLATVTAPVMVGGVIDVVGPFLPSSRGYAAIWPFAAIAVAVSMLFFRGIGPESSAGGVPVEADDADPCEPEMVESP
ncbi:MAG: MFS transporter [Thermoleophilia bacterium]|nr:MFS transporter [Thermoleophilia bacterium]